MSSTTYPLAATMPSSRRWLAFAVVIAAAFMDLLDSTIVNVAIPTIQKDLGTSYAQIEWVITAYALGFAASLITGGRLGDAFGRKRVFLVGVAGFTAASVLCGAAEGGGMLIAARALQGVMAGVMIPQVLAFVQVLFRREERNKAFGIYGASVGMAAVAGPIVSGVLLHFDVAGLGWRPIFLLNLPIGIAALAAAAALLPESRSEDRPGLDLVGVGLVTAALLALVYPLIQGRQAGWPWWSFALLAVSLPLLGAFGLWERRRGAKALVPLRLFRMRAFSAGLAANVALFSGVLAFFIVYTVYLQLGLGWTPLHTALAGFSFPIGTTVGAGVSIALAPKLGRLVLVAGTVIFTVGVGVAAVVLDAAGAGLQTWELLGVMALCGLGMGVGVPPLFDIVLAGVDTRDAGSASGVLNTAQQVGGAVGISVIGVVLFGLIPGHGFVHAAVVSLLVVGGMFVLAGLSLSFLPKTTDESSSPAESSEA
jgi:EmrB/QacA subfamily drug resistance transporter